LYNISKWCLFFWYSSCRIQVHTSFVILSYFSNRVEGGQKWISFGVCPNNETAANALGVCSVEYDGWYKRIYYQSSDMEYEKLTHGTNQFLYVTLQKYHKFLILFRCWWHYIRHGQKKCIIFDKPERDYWI